MVLAQLNLNSPVPRAVGGLDGTPTMPIWRGRLGLLGRELRQLLYAGQRQEYLTETLGNRYLRLTTGLKPYAATDGRNVPVEADVAEFERIADHHGEAVPLLPLSPPKRS